MFGQLGAGRFRGGDELFAHLEAAAEGEDEDEAAAAQAAIAHAAEVQDMLHQGRVEQPAWQQDEADAGPVQAGVAPAHMGGDNAEQLGAAAAGEPGGPQQAGLGDQQGADAAPYAAAAGQHEGQAGAARAKPGTGQWLRLHRHDPIAPGSDVTILQAAVMILHSKQLGKWTDASMSHLLYGIRKGFVPADSVLPR